MQKFFISYMLVINIIAFLLYGIDKLKARAGKWRITEAALLGMAVIGGCYGALAGMYLFHHKTRKPRFYVTVPLLAVLYAVIICRVFIIK